MYSSEELERFYFDYQTEWMPRGMSIQAYCSRNNVPYKVLDRWVRDIYKRVVPVQITGTPEELKVESPRRTVIRQETNPNNENGSIKIIISTLKLCGKSVWNFFGDYFRCEVLGLDTYKEYLPALSR